VTKPRVRVSDDPTKNWWGVAIAVAIALACAGAVSADRAGVPRVLGAAAGTAAALLGVLALPSFPTRRVTIALLTFGGLAIARHAALPGVDIGLIVVWAIATMFGLLLVDRAQAETTPRLHGSRALPSRGKDTMRVAAVLALVVFIAVIAFAPTIAQAVRRDVASGRVPNGGDMDRTAASLRASERLDMSSRPSLTDNVVFTVDADRPDFWRGETWDQWDGSGWTRSRLRGVETLSRNGTRIEVPVDRDDLAAQRGEPMRQTFHIDAPYSNVVFAAPTPVELDTDQLVVRRPDSSLAVVGGFGRGATYSVTSRRAAATEASLRASASLAAPDDIVEQYVQSPGSRATTARVLALAAEITANAPTPYDKVRAIESWLATHTKYSLDAPAARQDHDVVDDFVFVTHLGWCEQISSTLVVMLRSVGVPARVATGFVTGHRDALTGRYVVRERDAHAWAEVYFPGVGWQGFDPTASVPLAGEAPRTRSWLEQARAALPVIAVLVIVVIGGALALGALRRRAGRFGAQRAPSWAATMLRRVERLGRRAEVPVAPGQTVREYAQTVAVRVGEPQLVAVGAAIDADAFSAAGAAPADRADAERALTQVERAVRERRSRRRRTRVVRSLERPPTVKGIP
jgi:transglutaminase-like putative cysteine protease